MTLTARESDELLSLARSPAFAADMARVRASFIAPMTPDQYLHFASRLNAFLGHPTPPRLPFIEADMKL